MTAPGASGAESKVAARRVVEIDYAIRDAEGTLLERVEGFAYFHGAEPGVEQLPPGVERALVGHGAGDEITIDLLPADGYGERDPGALFRVARSSLPAGTEPQLGEPLLMEDERGDAIPVWVAHADDAILVLDANHPLAGMRVSFEVRVRSVRAASREEEEKAAMAKGRATRARGVARAR